MTLPPPPAAGAGAAKRARHRRWARVSWVVTGAGLLGFLGFAAFWIADRAARSPTAEQEQNCRTFMDGYAGLIRRYAEQRGRLPATLLDLRSPDLDNPFEAEPLDCWGKPIEYRIADPAARTFRLRSCGPDATPDTLDDLVWPSGEAFR